VDLTGAVLAGADLTGAVLPHFTICPEEGPFVAWKKVHGAILKLEVIGKRVSTPIGRKCRAESVRVLEAFGGVGPFASLRDASFIYTAGGIATAILDEDIRVECTSGIHFYMTRKEAEENRL
jgi:hypothetical protein